jgi:hypothetical protein
MNIKNLLDDFMKKEFSSVKSITMWQTEWATLRCGDFFYAPTGQKAHSTGQRPVKIAPNNSSP